MSDIKIFNYKKNKKLSFNKQSIIDLKEIVKNNSEELLGITPIAFDILLNEENNLKAEMLALDENLVLTILEYRIGRFGQVINKGLLIIDYINRNQGKIKLLLNELIGYEKARDVNLNARLISLADDFNKFDEFAVKQMIPEIDLIKFSFFDKDILILEKVYQGKKVIMDEFDNKDIQTDFKLLKEITDYVLSLGDEVVQKGFNNYLCFRKIKSFLYIYFDDVIILQIKIKDKYKEYRIKTIREFEKIEKIIEESYENA